MKPAIIACPPVDAAKQRELGIIAFQPAEGALQGNCERCQSRVWIGTRAAEIKVAFPDAKIVCFGCVTAARDAAKLKDHLRGVGGRYLVRTPVLK
jgi:hypothetical protein